MQDTLKARREQQDTESQAVPHGCYGGWHYLGHLIVDDDGEEVEVIERVRCSRCAISEHHERF